MIMVTRLTSVSSGFWYMASGDTLKESFQDAVEIQFVSFRSMDFGLIPCLRFSYFNETEHTNAAQYEC